MGKFDSQEEFLKSHKVADIPKGIELGYLGKGSMSWYNRLKALEAPYANSRRDLPNRERNKLEFMYRGGNQGSWDKIIENQRVNRQLSQRQSASIKAAAAIKEQQSKPKPASKPAPKPTKQNTFVTGSGSVNVFKGGKEISPATKEGTTIQDIYDRQAAQREINKEQKKLFDRVTGAADYKQAFNIQEKSRAINPNVGTFQAVFRDGELKETRGREGLGDRTVTKTDFFGNPVADYKQSFLVDDTGKRIASIDSQSRGSEFDFFKTTAKKTAVYGPPAQASTFDFFNLGGGKNEKKRQSDNNYLKDDEKAFFFFPDVPQGDDFLSQFGRGVTKGASNTLAGVWNVGLMAGSGIQQATGGKAIPEKDFVPFYSTPVTNVESGFFDAAAGTGKSFFTGEKYDAKKRVQTGFDEAYDNFFSKPVESAGSLVELVPYFGYGAAKTGVRAAGDFFGSLGKTTTKGSKATGPKKTGNFAQDFFYEKPDKSTIFNLDTASTFSSKNVKTGSGVTQFFDTSAKGTGKTSGKTGPDDFFKATTRTKLTKGGGTFKEYRATDFGKNFMGSPTKTGQFLIQKTKQKVKQKPQNKLVDQFFKPMQKQKTKTKQKQKVKQKQDFFTAFIPKVSSKQKQDFFTTPKQKQKTRQKLISIPKNPQKQKGDFFVTPPKNPPTGQTTVTPPVTTTIFGGFWALPRNRRGRGSRTKRNKRGDKSFTAWNVDESKVGSFFGGPSYRTSKSTRVFKDADARNKRAAKKQRKKNKDFVTGFFD